MSPDAQTKLELELLTLVAGGGKLKDGVSAGTLMVQSFLNEQISEAGKEKKDTPLKGRKSLVVDGDNGARTKATIKLYQEQRHLDSQDGVVGLETYAQMKKDGFDIDKAIAAKDAYLTSPEGKKYAQEVAEATTAQEATYRMEKAKTRFHAPEEKLVPAPTVQFRLPTEDFAPDFIKAQEAAKLRAAEPQMRVPQEEPLEPPAPLPQMREPSLDDLLVNPNGALPKDGDGKGAKR